MSLKPRKSNFAPTSLSDIDESAPPVTKSITLDPNKDKKKRREAVVTGEFSIDAVFRKVKENRGEIEKEKPNYKKFKHIFQAQKSPTVAFQDSAKAEKDEVYKDDDYMELPDEMEEKITKKTVKIRKSITKGLEFGKRMSTEKESYIPKQFEKIVQEESRMKSNSEFYKSSGAARDLTHTKVNINDMTSDNLIDVAISILKKPAHSRDKRSVDVLVTCMHNVEFFKSHDSDTVQKCLKNMSFLSLKKNQVVFTLGAPGTQFFVILRGSVGVKLFVENKDIRDYEGNPIKEMQEVRVLPAGSGFGELALMDSRPRAATIYCKEDCQFAVLDKEPFLKILKEKEIRKLFKEIDFLASLPVFKKWSYFAVKNLYYHAPIRTVKRGIVMYSEGDESEGMFIIKRGEFKVTKSVEYGYKKHDSEAADADLQKLFRKPTQKKIVDVAILGEKEFFGEEEMLLDVKRMYTVTCCSSDAEYFEITKKEFQLKIMKNASSVRWLQDNTKNRESRYQQRLSDINKNSLSHKQLLMNPQAYNNNKFISNSKQLLPTLETAPEEHEFMVNTPLKQYAQTVTNYKDQKTKVIMFPSPKAPSNDLYLGIKSQLRQKIQRENDEERMFGEIQTPPNEFKSGIKFGSRSTNSKPQRPTKHPLFMNESVSHPRKRATAFTSASRSRANLSRNTNIRENRLNGTKGSTLENLSKTGSGILDHSELGLYRKNNKSVQQIRNPENQSKKRLFQRILGKGAPAQLNPNNSSLHHNQTEPNFFSPFHVTTTVSSQHFDDVEKPPTKGSNTQNSLDILRSDDEQPKEESLEFNKSSINESILNNMISNQEGDISKINNAESHSINLKNGQESILTEVNSKPTQSIRYPKSFVAIKRTIPSSQGAFKLKQAQSNKQIRTKKTLLSTMNDEVDKESVNLKSEVSMSHESFLHLQQRAIQAMSQSPKNKREEMNKSQSPRNKGSPSKIKRVFTRRENFYPNIVVNSPQKNFEKQESGSLRNSTVGQRPQ